MSAVGLPDTRRTLNAGRAAGIGAAATVLLLLAAFVATNVSASLAQRNLREGWAARLDGATEPVVIGDPVARLRIAAIGVDAVVVEGPGNGSRGPVHIATTALPGDGGLAAIEGGRLGFGSFFGAIDRLDVGDDIAVQTRGGVVTYRVIDVRRLPASAVDLTSNGDAAILLLIAPASRFGGSERIVVRARAVPEGGS